MKRAIWMTFFLAAALMDGAQSSAPNLEANVENLFSSWNRPDVPGAAVAVVQDGRIVLLKGFGSANLEHRQPVTASTLFDAASLAKQFTAFAIFQLQEQGLLNPGDEVRKHLPEFPDFGVPLTIRQLLHHQSGLRDWGGLLQMCGGRMEDQVGTGYIMNLLKNQRELNFPPGTEFSYSNAGYIVLAEIVGRVGKIPFPQWAKENIFAPLGMESARFSPQLGEVLAGAASSYKPGRDGEFTQIFNSAALPGPGSLHLSITDMAKWLGNFQTRTLGSEALWRAFLEQPTLADGSRQDYAAGLIRGEFRGVPVWSHSGGWAGFRGETLYFPQQKLAIAILVNQTAIDPTGLARSVADICLQGKLPEPKTPAAKPLPAKELLQSYAGRYWLFGDQVIFISVSGDHLKFQVGAGPLLDLETESDRLYRFAMARIRIEFPAGSQKKIAKLFFWQGDYAYQAERLSDQPLPAIDPREYEGLYFSPELRSIQEIKLDSGKLVLASLRRGDLPLIHLDKDAFGGAASSTKLIFRRNAKGEVRELLFSLASEARNVRFVRVSPPLE